MVTAMELKSSAEGPIAPEGGIRLEQALADLAERIREHDRRRRKIADALKGLKGRVNPNEVDGPAFGEISESYFTRTVRRDELSDKTVIGVDGGLLTQQLHGLDLILVRAVAAIFHYTDGELDEVEYFPSEFPPPRLVDLTEPIDAREFELVVGVERQLAELQMAIQAVTSRSADLLLLDGSVAPQYIDRSVQGHRALRSYRRLIGTFGKLYEACDSTGTLLAGAVKDSRSSRFIDILRRKVLSFLPELSPEEREVLENSRDTVLLDRVLEVGERTFAFRYAENPGDVLKDLGKWASRIHVFYMKVVPYDRPLRVEFVDGGDGTSGMAERVASLLYSLSAHHDAFGLPSVLIEADARARLHGEEICMVRDSLADFLGPSVTLDLRRHRWPF
jgi:hypothetical protein